MNECYELLRGIDFFVFFLFRSRYGVKLIRFSFDLFSSCRFWFFNLISGHGRQENEN